MPLDVVFKICVHFLFFVSVKQQHGSCTKSTFNFGFDASN